MGILLYLQLRIRLAWPPNGLARHTERMARMEILCVPAAVECLDRSAGMMDVLVVAQIQRLHGAFPQVVIQVLQRIPFLDTG